MESFMRRLRFVYMISYQESNSFCRLRPGIDRYQEIALHKVSKNGTLFSNTSDDTQRTIKPVFRILQCDLFYS